MKEKVAYQRPKELRCPDGDSERCIDFDKGLKAMARWIQDRTIPAHADAGYTYESFEVLGVCVEGAEWVDLLDELGLEKIEEDGIIKRIKERLFRKEDVSELFIYHSPLPPPGKDKLLTKLKDGNILPEELNRLEDILKWEEEEAKRTGQGMALISISGMLVLIEVLKRYKGGS